MFIFYFCKCFIENKKYTKKLLTHILHGLTFDLFYLDLPTCTWIRGKHTVDALTGLAKVCIFIFIHLVSFTWLDPDLHFVNLPTSTSCHKKWPNWLLQLMTFTYALVQVPTFFFGLKMTSYILLEFNDILLFFWFYFFIFIRDKLIRL